MRLVRSGYIDRTEDLTDIDSLFELANEMYADFIERVHDVRTLRDVSPTIRNCREYIKLHVCEWLSASDLSDQFGYSDYYLNKKFKAETGMSIADFQSKPRLS